MSDMTKTISSRQSKGLRNKLIQLRIDRPRNLKNDILSGITVALALVPEAIAFSFVANVDPRVGLYAAFMMGLITALIGGRPGMISGATGAVAVIFAPMVKQQLEAGGMESALGYLFAAVALMGIIQILFGIFRFGKFIRLIPHPVMLGFVNGLAIIIFRAQFGQFYVGIGKDAQLMQTEPLLIMSALIALTMAISIFLPKITKAIPATLTAIIIVTILSYYLKQHGFEIRTVLDFVKDISPGTETIATSLPSFAIPNVPFSFATLKIIMVPAALAAAVGLIESLMTLTLIDELTDTRGRSNKECIGQGVANLVNGFFGGMGGCAMIGQSMINIRAGGRTRLSGITAALVLISFVVWGATVIEMIPLAALVGVMFMVVIATFEWTSFRIIPKIPRSDAFIIIAVSSLTVIFNLAIAVIAGVIISALVFAWEHGRQIHATIREDQKQKLYRLNGPLFFGSVASFKELFDVHNDPDNIIIDFENSRVCDHSALESVNNIAERYEQVGKKLHLLNLSPECAQLIKKADSIVEISVIKDLEWHIADDTLA